MIVQDNDPYTQPSFSLGNRFARCAWGVVQATLFRCSPRPLHFWRSFLLRMFGTKIGAHVHVYPGVKIWAPWNLQIGDYVGVADGVTIYNIARVEIGTRCVVSQGSHLCTGSHDIDSWNFQLIARPIRLGDYAWICAEAFVGPGVVVAEGCVVAARGVVVKSIEEPWSVWAGNPVLFKRARNPALAGG